ncbi:MAG: hypothetical protein WCD70_06650 [Alphaproteobacteria bacterium]
MTKISILVLTVLLAVSIEAQASSPTPEQVNSFFATNGMTGLAQNAKDVFAQSLTAEDINSYLSFMKTDTGKRYADFNKKAAEICVNGMKGLMNKQVSAETPLTLSPEQSKNYQRMLLITSTFQVFQYLHAHDQADDGVVQKIMMEAVLKQSPDQLGDLYKEYAGNLDAFDAYNKTQAAQDVITATLKASQQMAKDKVATH